MIRYHHRENWERTFNLHILCVIPGPFIEAVLIYNGAFYSPFRSNKNWLQKQKWLNNRRRKKSRTIELILLMIWPQMHFYDFIIEKFIDTLAVVWQTLAWILKSAIWKVIHTVYLNNYFWNIFWMEGSGQ